MLSSFYGEIFWQTKIQDPKKNTARMTDFSLLHRWSQFMTNLDNPPWRVGGRDSTLPEPYLDVPLEVRINGEDQ